MNLAQALSEELVKLGWNLDDDEAINYTCINCGDSLDKKFQFCPKCGTKVEKQYSKSVEELEEALNKSLSRLGLYVS